MCCPTSSVRDGAARGGWWRWVVLVFAVAIGAGCATSTGLSTRSFDELRGALAARDYEQAVRLVHAHPADLDFARALDISIRFGDVDAVTFFLSRVSPDAHLDLDHTTPLIRAVVAAPPTVRRSLVELLLAAGADPARRDRFGRDARTYAMTRADFDLAQLLGAPGLGDRNRYGTAAIKRWLPPPASGAATTVAQLGGSASRVDGQVDPPVGGPAAAPATWGPDANESQIAAAHAATVRAERAALAASGDGSSARRIPVTVSAPLNLSQNDLLRGSPWVPSAAARPRDGVAAFRFHADGTADVLRYRAAADRFEALPGAFAAWWLQRGHLRLAVVGRQFSALCVGIGTEGEQVALACSDPEGANASAGWPRLAGQDGARVVLTGIPGELEIGEEDKVVTAIRPHGGGSCTPSASRPKAPADASASRAGDWHVFDSRSLEVHAPLTGRACLQTEARQVALRACRDGSKNCLSLGGCMAGQVSAIAALPGVDAGWLACGAGYDEARSRALQACRAQLGCECQLIAIFGENVNIARDPICRVRR